MTNQLPILMKRFSNIEFRAGGLNHLSILLEAGIKILVKTAIQLFILNSTTFIRNLLLI